MDHLSYCSWVGYLRGGEEGVDWRSVGGGGAENVINC